MKFKTKEEFRKGLIEFDRNNGVFRNPEETIKVIAKELRSKDSIIDEETVIRLICERLSLDETSSDIHSYVRELIQPPVKVVYRRYESILVAQ